MINYKEILTDEDLKKASIEILKYKAITIDTEFVRVRTYFPNLGLIQLATLENTYLIDPISIKDLTPFIQILENKSILKILFGCSEDLFIFKAILKSNIANFIDFQILASFYNGKYQGSLSQLCLEYNLIDTQMNKEITLSDWTKRPLTKEQKLYSALDVKLLLKLYNIFQEKENFLKYYNISKEESLNIAASASKKVINSQDYNKCILNKISKMIDIGNKQKIFLYNAIKWRDSLACKKNIPSSFILKDKDLNTLARNLPNSLYELKKSLPPNVYFKYGKTLFSFTKKNEAINFALGFHIHYEAHQYNLSLLKDNSKTIDREHICNEMLFSKTYLENLLFCIYQDKVDAATLLNSWRKPYGVILLNKIKNKIKIY